MARKKPIQREKAVADDRQKTVVPRWTVLSEKPGAGVILDSEPFRGPSGWNKEEIFRAQQAYPGRPLAFRDKDSSGTYLNREEFSTVEGGLSKEGRNRLSQFEGKIKAVQYYDPPKARLSFADIPDETPKSKGISVEGKKIVKITHTPAELKRMREELAGNAPSVAPPSTKIKGTDAFHEKLAKTREKLDRKLWVDPEKKKRDVKKARAAKRVVEKKPRKAQAPGSRKAMPHRYYSARTGKTYYTSKARLSERIAARKRRLERSRARFSERAREAKKKAAAAKVRAKAARENKNLRARERRVVARQARISAFAEKARSLPGAGKKPFAFVKKGKLFAKQAGRMAKTLPRDMRYPPMRHSSASPLKPPVSMKAVSGRQTISPVKAKLRPSVKGAKMYSTGTTLATGKFPVGGAGVMFRIDAEQVIENLIVRFPAALKAAAVSAGDVIGRKLLDIVEPYVPKDTGLLYSTAVSNSSQAAAGLVDIEGGEGYPSDQMFGVTISYNAPYAGQVYFDETKRHGKEYNAFYKTSKKGDKETARWIEEAFKRESVAVASLVGEFSNAITGALEAAGIRSVSFGRGGKTVSFYARKG